MDRHKLSLIGAALAAVVLVAGGWFVGVQPQLASASSADAQRASIEATNSANRVVLQKLETEYRELGRSEQALAALRESVPSTPDTAGFTRQVQAAVTGSGVTMTSLTFGTLQAYAPAGTSATTGAATTADPSASPSQESTPASVATPAAVPTPAAPQAYRNDQITASTFDLLPVTVAVDSTSYQQAIDFAKRMQHTDRLFLVNTLSQTAKDSGGASESWSLSGYVYVVHAAATGSAPSSDSTSTADSAATSTKG